MNIIFCSSNQEDELLEAINTLEKEKIKQNEKNNYYSQLNTIRNSNYSPNKINSLTTRDPSLTGINLKKHILKKNSSLLEIIDYPFSQNSRRISEIHLQSDTNITDKNEETELMIEYTNKYMNQPKNIINNYQNKVKDNIIYKNNLIDNQNCQNINFNINNNNVKDINVDSIDSYSNSTLIINNDYNTSMIAELKNNKNKKIGFENISLLNNKKMKKESYINTNNSLTENTLKNPNYLSHKIKKSKNYINQDFSKNDSINNSKLYYNFSKNSIYFNTNSYSNDTEISKDNIKYKNESFNLTRINNQDKILKENDYKIKEKIKEIPKGKNNKRKNVLSIKNKEKKSNSNLNVRNNNLKNLENNIKNINKSKIPNKHFNNSNKKFKSSNSNLINKNLCLSNINNTNLSKSIKKNNITKSYLNINYLISKNNTKNIHNNYSSSNKNLFNKSNNNKLNLLTDIKKIFNNIKKINRKKSNSEKRKSINLGKNINLYSDCISILQNTHLENTFSTKNQIYDYKKLIKYYYSKENSKDINNKKNNIKLERNSSNNLYKMLKSNTNNIKLNISHRNQSNINENKNNSNKTDINIVITKSIYNSEKNNKNYKNINIKSYQNNKINKRINYIKNEKNIIPNYKIKIAKTFNKCKSYTSTRNNSFFINIKELKISGKNLKTFDRTLLCQKNKKIKNNNSKIPYN